RAVRANSGKYGKCLIQRLLEKPLALRVSDDPFKSLITRPQREAVRNPAPRPFQQVPVIDSGLHESPIAMFPTVSFESRMIAVAPGDLLAVVSDGFLEVTNAKGEELGSGALKKLLVRAATEPLPQNCGPACRGDSSLRKPRGQPNDTSREGSWVADLRVTLFDAPDAVRALAAVGHTQTKASVPVTFDSRQDTNTRKERPFIMG